MTYFPKFKYIFQGIEFRNPEKAPGGWLPLEAYDDKEYETKKPSDWLKMSNMANIAKYAS